MTEAEKAIKLADKILDRPTGDPDDDLAVLSRQLLRALETISKLTLALQGVCQSEFASRKSYELANLTLKQIGEPIKMTTTKGNVVSIGR